MAKQPTSQEAWRLFLAELDRNAVAAAHVRKWTAAGADLPRIFTFAGASFNRRHGRQAGVWEREQQARGRLIKEGWRRAIGGLEKVAKAAGDSPAMAPVRTEAEGMATVLRVRLENANRAYTQKRPGTRSQYVNTDALMLLRQYAGAGLRALPSHDAVLAVVRCAAVAYGRQCEFDQHLEAAKRALIRRESSPVAVGAARRAAPE